jgi:hypothetical protein
MYLSDKCPYLPLQRIALHPRVYLKLSPLPLSSILPSSISTPLRSADVPTSTLSSAVAGAVQSTTNVALQTVNAAEGLTGNDRRGELLRRLRIFLDTALEAFGEERIVWAASLVAEGMSKNTHSDVEEWFEVCRESLATSGLNQSSMNHVFAQ